MTKARTVKREKNKGQEKEVQSPQVHDDNIAKT